MDTNATRAASSVPPMQLVNWKATAIQDHALVDWKTTAMLLDMCVPWAKKTLEKNNVPLVHVSQRKRLPRWGALRAFLESRERSSAAA